MTKTSCNNSNLDKKLGAYALAGAAMLAAPAAASASIQYVPVNQTFTSSDAVPGIDLTLTANATVVVSALPASSLGPSLVLGFSSPGGGFLTDASGAAAALTFGAAIDPADPNFGKTATLAVHGVSGPGGWSTTGGDAYLGFEFTDTDGFHAGWAHVITAADATTSSFKLLDYAYNTTPNKPITAGQGEVAPEPSSLALLALGATGLLAYRRRRAARV